LTRDILGRFKTGNNGGPGRPAGSRNNFGGEVVAAIQADWQAHGAGVLEKVRRMHPAAYLRVVASLVPREVLLDTRSEFSHLSDEELDNQIFGDLASMAIRLQMPELADAIKLHRPHINLDCAEGQRTKRKQG
jgi:hypothetical protein